MKLCGIHPWAILWWESNLLLYLEIACTSPRGQGVDVLECKPISGSNCDHYACNNCFSLFHWNDYHVGIRIYCANKVMAMWLWMPWLLVPRYHQQQYCALLLAPPLKWLYHVGNIALSLTRCCISCAHGHPIYSTLIHITYNTPIIYMAVPSLTPHLHRYINSALWRIKQPLSSMKKIFLDLQYLSVAQW